MTYNRLRHSFTHSHVLACIPWRKRQVGDCKWLDIIIWKWCLEGKAMWLWRLECHWNPEQDFCDEQCHWAPPAGGDSQLLDSCSQRHVCPHPPSVFSHPPGAAVLGHAAALAASHETRRAARHSVNSPTSNTFNACFTFHFSRPSSVQRVVYSEYTTWQLIACESLSCCEYLLLARVPVLFR